MNLTNLAVSALVANSVSNNITGLNAWDFLTAGTSLNKMGASGWEVTGDPHRARITLQEIFAGTQTSGTTSISEAIGTNLKNNWMQLAIGVIGIPIAANVTMKLLRKPIVLPLNRLLGKKGLGLEVKV